MTQDKKTGAGKVQNAAGQTEGTQARGNQSQAAPNADPSKVDARTRLSAEALAAGMPGGWQGDPLLIWREWTFDNYLDGVHFAERVAQQAEAVKHHPDMLITYRRVRISYTTHDAGGVTALDLEEAASLDDLR
ncbi:4a-hydroxytetrahydrobiopterin dehydratase [Deinococcus sp.]|uniref:4a-hydroxytetrahydrobiopterin dehydratase n=1 Tax=Deinococcus sp. TaxID=47478 RepID=UPI003C7B5561